MSSYTMKAVPRVPFWFPLTVSEEKSMERDGKVHSDLLDGAVLSKDVVQLLA